MAILHKLPFTPYQMLGYHRMHFEGLEVTKCAKHWNFILPGCCSIAALVHPWLKLYTLYWFYQVKPKKQALPVLFLHSAFLCLSIGVSRLFSSWMLVTFILVSIFFAFEAVLVCWCFNQQSSRKDICQTLSLWVSRGEVWRSLAESG